MNTTPTLAAHPIGSDLLASAIRNPAGTEMERLLRIIDTHGLRNLSSGGLRATAHAVRQSYQGTIAPSLDFLLHRLETAGHPQTYSAYMATELLCRPRGDRPIPVFARSIFRSIQDLAEDLRQTETLADHPRRPELLLRVDQVVDECRTRGFGPGVIPSNDPFAVRLSAMPESDVRDERIFQRTVQSHELVFHAGVVLSSQAIEAVSHGFVAEAIVALQYLVSLEELFTPLLRLLKAMSVEDWLVLRNYIVLPSAIQGTRYHTLKANLPELARILDHPRVFSLEQPNVPRGAELVKRTEGLLKLWERMHFGVVKKYTPDDSEGKLWQQRQVG